MWNEELKRLQANIAKLIEAGYEDENIDEFIEESSDANELNDIIEDQLSYGGDE